MDNSIYLQRKERRLREKGKQSAGLSFASCQRCSLDIKLLAEPEGVAFCMRISVFNPAAVHRRSLLWQMLGRLEASAIKNGSK